MEQITFQVDEKALAPIRGLVIGANFEETKAALDKKLESYKTLVVTETGVSDAKADLAHIRKIKSKLDEARIAVKKAYTEPLAVFEAKCRELTDICTVCIENIDGQVKRFENEQKQKKISALSAFFEDNAKSLDGLLDFESIRNPRWENKTYSIEDAQKDILREIGIASAAIGAIAALHSEFETELLATYRNTRDLAAVMQKNERLTEIKKINERRKQGAENRNAEKERQEAEYIAQFTEKRVQEVRAGTAASVIPATETASEAPLHVIDFRVWVNDEQMANLRDFLKSNNIRYGRVPLD